MKKNIICLAIETSAKHLGISVQEYDHQTKKIKLLGRRFSLEPGKQSEQLIPGIVSLQKSCRLAKDDISLVGVNHGPGSFTGIRVGVSAGRAIAQGLNIPIFGVCGLEAVARQSTQKKKNIVVTLSALPGEIYFAIYHRQPWRVLQIPTWGRIEAYETRIKKIKMEDRVILENQPVKPEAIGRLAIEKFINEKNKKIFHYENTKPLYLQPSWAER